jgi:hypothetical protein
VRRAVVALVGALFVPAAPALAQDRTCSGSLGAVTVENLESPRTQAAN